MLLPSLELICMVLKHLGYKSSKNFSKRVLTLHQASLVTQTVKHLPTMRETWVWSLRWEDPLEKEMATHSSIHAWEIPWTKEPGGLQSMGSQRVRHDWMTSFFQHYRIVKTKELHWLDSKQKLMKTKVKSDMGVKTGFPEWKNLLITDPNYSTFIEDCFC